LAGLRYYPPVLDEQWFINLVDFLGGPTAAAQISTAKIILEGASPSLLSAWQDASDKTKIAIAALAAGQFALDRMPRAASGFLHAKGVGVDPAYESLVAGDIPNLDASKITSGTFPVARGGTGLSTIAAGGILYASGLDTLSRIAPSAANQVLRSTGANALQIAALVAADIPSLDASKITTGRFTAARLLDAASGYLHAKGVGVDPAYELLAASDIPNLDASKITTGRFGLARLPDATSGFLKAQGAGVDPAYSAILGGDLPSHTHVKADVTDFAHGSASHSGSIIPAADQNFQEYQALAFRVENLASLPGAGNKGRLVLLTTDNKVYYDNGTAWVAW